MKKWGEVKMIDKLIDGLARGIMGVSALLVFVITFLQVLCRFVLKSPLPWSTDILRLAFTYLVFWGAAWCVREKEHLNVDVVLTALPAGVRRWTEIVINLILCGFSSSLSISGSSSASLDGRRPHPICRFPCQSTMQASPARERQCSTTWLKFS